MVKKCSAGPEGFHSVFGVSDDVIGQHGVPCCSVWKYTIQVYVINDNILNGPSDSGAMMCDLQWQ